MYTLIDILILIPFLFEIFLLDNNKTELKVYKLVYISKLICVLKLFRYARGVDTLR